MGPLPNWPFIACKWGLLTTKWDDPPSTLQGTNISPLKAIFENDSPFPVWWDMFFLPGGPLFWGHQNTKQLPPLVVWSSWSASSIFSVDDALWFHFIGWGMGGSGRDGLPELPSTTTLPETNIAPENEPLEKELPMRNQHF